MVGGETKGQEGFSVFVRLYSLREVVILPFTVHVFYLRLKYRGDGVSRFKIL